MVGRRGEHRRQPERVDSEVLHVRQPSFDLRERRRQRVARERPDVHLVHGGGVGPRRAGVRIRDRSRPVRLPVDSDRLHRAVSVRVRDRVDPEAVGVAAEVVEWDTERPSVGPALDSLDRLRVGVSVVDEERDVDVAGIRRRLRRDADRCGDDENVAGLVGRLETAVEREAGTSRPVDFVGDAVFGRAVVVREEADGVSARRNPRVIHPLVAVALGAVAR